MAKAEKTLTDLFETTLREPSYFAEKQILRALPKMAEKAKSPGSPMPSRSIATRPRSMSSASSRSSRSSAPPRAARPGDAIVGILDEGKGIMEDFAGTDALVPACSPPPRQWSITRYSRYGTLRTWAEQLGEEDAAKLLDLTPRRGRRPTRR